MSETSKKARADMKAKAKRMATGEPGAKIDASSWSPPEALNADKQTGLRPVSPRQFKRGGKLKGKAAAARADRKPRKSGGAAVADKEVAAKINRNVKEANAEKFGKPHEGGMKRGGNAKRPGKAFGGPLSIQEQALLAGTGGGSPSPLTQTGAQAALAGMPQNQYPGGALSPATLSPQQMQAITAQLGGNPTMLTQNGRNDYDNQVAMGTYGGPRPAAAPPPVSMGAMYGMAPQGAPPPTSPPPPMVAPTSPPPPMQQAAPTPAAFNPYAGSGATQQITPQQLNAMGAASTQGALQNGQGQMQDGRSPYYNPAAGRPAMGGGMGMAGRPPMGAPAGGMAGGFGRPRKAGGSVNGGDSNYTGGTRPTGGRIARATGGKSGKGKTNIIIAVNPGGSMGGDPAQQQAQRQQMPVPVQPPPPPQGVPMQMPAGPPPGPQAGAPPPAQMMPRKSGGRTVKKTASSYKDMTAGSLGGVGRMQKGSIQEKKGNRLGAPS